MQDLIFIVGDKFRNFSNNHSVVTFSQFKQKMSLSTIKKSTKTGYIVVQGLSEREEKSLQELSYSGILNHVVLHRKSPPKEKAPYVHKSLQENIMIAEPTVINNKLFYSQLMLDDECAEMRDHVTGQHIQGMVIIEAARQMMLAVSERYLLPKEYQFNSYFVLQRISSEFMKFVFPLDIDIVCKVKKLERAQYGKSVGEFLIEFTQNNELSALVTIEFSTYDKSWLMTKENVLAEHAIKQTINNLENEAYSFCNLGNG